MNGLEQIDVHSIVMHRSFAVNKALNIFIDNVNERTFVNLKGYSVHVIISGRYISGKRFIRNELEMNPTSFREMTQCILWPESKHNGY